MKKCIHAFEALLFAPLARRGRRKGRWPAGFLLAIGSGWMATTAVRADGITEPDQVLYGTITALNGTESFRLTSGTLTWTYQRLGDGLPVTVSTRLTNINDQFSYVLRLRCESVLPGQILTSNVLQIAPGSHSYSRAQVSIDGTLPAAFVIPSQSSVVLSPADRGRLERIDLQVAVSLQDADGDGLPDVWERQHFGGLQFAAGNDPDGDGLNNRAELKAGTNPNDPDSRFAFIRVSAHPTGGTVVEWSSVAGETYELQRSSDLLAGFLAVQGAIPATAPKNTYHDATALGAGPYFYRLRLHE